MPPLLLAVLGLSTRVPVALHGLSVSPTGFVALLRSTVPDRVLPLPITRSRTVDVSTAESLEALTLLQLWQGIDLAGPMLPPESLDRLATREASRLLQVRVRATGDCELLVAASGESVECDASAFEGIALCLRYGSQLVAAADAMEGDGSIDGADLSAKFARCFTRADADAQQQRIKDELQRNTVESGLGVPLPQNANSPPRALLEKALAIARDRGDSAAAALIEARIEEVYGGERAGGGQEVGGSAAASPLDRLMEQLQEQKREEEE
jgi:hypothetical protein